MCWILWHLWQRNFKLGRLVAKEGKLEIAGNSNANVSIGDSARIVVKSTLYLPTVDIIDIDGESMMPNSKVFAQFYFSSPSHFADSLAHSLSIPVEKI